MNSFIQCLKYIASTVVLVSLVLGGFGIFGATIWFANNHTWGWILLILEVSVILGVIIWMNDSEGYNPIFPYVDYKNKIKNRKVKRNEKNDN